MTWTQTVFISLIVKTEKNTNLSINYKAYLGNYAV